ncbi:MAG: hypothetical protein K0R73_1372 [Candidatus Midichloriaceae bacterium]|jgi:hypothetical protein|nr:hypothetical protein [Candidatus Midichloriaceae bacterium]
MTENTTAIGFNQEVTTEFMETLLSEHASKFTKFLNGREATAEELAAYAEQAGLSLEQVLGSTGLEVSGVLEMFAAYKAKYETPAEEVAAAEVTETPAEEVAAAEVTETPAEEVVAAADTEAPAEEVVAAEVTEAPAEEVVAAADTEAPAEEVVAADTEAASETPCKSECADVCNGPAPELASTTPATQDDMPA